MSSKGYEYWVAHLAAIAEESIETKAYARKRSIKHRVFKQRRYLPRVKRFFSYQIQAAKMAYAKSSLPYERLLSRVNYLGRPS